MDDKWLHLNYHHLLYFALVVQEGGLVPAANRLGISHPTVSEQVKKLEAQLGLRLFERRGRRLQLTEAGRVVYRHARELFGVGAALVEAVEAWRGGRTVLGRIGIDSVLAKLVVRRVLAPVLDGLGDALHLRCVEEGRDELLQELQARHLEVVLSDASSGAAPEGLRTRQLDSSEIAFFAAPRLIDQLEGPFPGCLENAPFLLPLALTRLRRELERWLGERRIQPRIVGEIADSGLLKALGQDGRGVFAMPASVASEIEHQYDVRMLGLADGLEARVFAVTTAAAEDHPVVRQLFDERSP